MKQNMKQQKQSLTSRLAEVTRGVITELALPSIVAAIERDHMDLRKFIKVLKDKDASLPEKKKAFTEFSALLKSHSKAEEKSVYAFCLKVAGMEQESHEGYTEHAVADELMQKLSRIREPKKWQATAKVLAELVEHHAMEEEKEFLPALKAKVDSEDQQKLRTLFLQLRRKTQPHPDAENSGVLVA